MVGRNDGKMSKNTGKDLDKNEGQEKFKGQRPYFGKEEFGREDGVAEVGEDATKYGEFMSSYFAWIPLPDQKQRAEELDNMTKKSDQKGK